jgi:hypothetical protein
VADDRCCNVSDEQTANLDRLDEQVFGYPDPIEDRLLAFIRANAAEMRL